MKFFGLLFILSGLLMSLACSSESTSDLQQHARPDDSSVRVIRVRDGSQIRFVLVSQGRGFELTCEQPDGLLNLIDATGFPSVLLNSYPALPIDSSEVVKLAIAAQPKLDCKNKDGNLFLYKSFLENETKYFFAAKSSRELFMFGCQGLAEAMGLQLEKAQDLPTNLIENGIFNADDRNDLNCLKGVKIGAKARFEEGVDRTLGAVPGTVIKPITFTARNPDNQFAPLSVSMSGLCDWIEVQTFSSSLVLRGTASRRFRNTSCQITITASSGTIMEEKKQVFVQACGGLSMIDAQNQCQSVATSWQAAAAGGIPTGTKLLGSSFVDPLKGWVSAADGSIFHTIDGGSSWAKQSSTVSIPLEDIAFVNKDFGLAVGASGTILRTTNAGMTWERRPIGSSSYLTSIAFFDASSAWIGGTNEVLRTFDGGVNWFSSRMPAAGQIWSLSFTDRFTGWAVGEAGLVFTTSDGGESWVKVATPATTYLRAVHFISRDKGWILASTGVVYQTHDAGFTWTTSTIGEAGGFEALHFFNESIGWASSNQGGLYMTRNGGGSWIAVATGLTESINSLSFADAGHGFATTFNGKILMTQIP